MVSHSSVVTVHEWHWEYTFAWKLLAVAGNDVESTVLLSRSGAAELVTQTDAAPRREV
jgi:hypothetical protein